MTPRKLSGGLELELNMKALSHHGGLGVNAAGNTPANANANANVSHVQARTGCSGPVRLQAANLKDSLDRCFMRVSVGTARRVLGWVYLRQPADASVTFVLTLCISSHLTC